MGFQTRTEIIPTVLNDEWRILNVFDAETGKLLKSKTCATLEIAIGEETDIILEEVLGPVVTA